MHTSVFSYSILYLQACRPWNVRPIKKPSTTKLFSIKLLTCWVLRYQQSTNVRWVTKVASQDSRHAGVTTTPGQQIIGGQTERNLPCGGRNASFVQSIRFQQKLTPCLPYTLGTKLVNLTFFNMECYEGWYEFLQHTTLTRTKTCLVCVMIMICWMLQDSLASSLDTETQSHFWRQRKGYGICGPNIVSTEIINNWTKNEWRKEQQFMPRECRTDNDC